MRPEFTPETLPQAIKALLTENNYHVSGPEQIHGAEIDLIALSLTDPFASPVYLEVTIQYVDNEKYGKDLTKLSMLQRMDPGAKCLIVSSSGFSPAVKERARSTGIDTLTYEELFAKFERFNSYLQSITQSGETAGSLRELDSVYEEPYFEDRLGQDKALNFLKDWRNQQQGDNRWLIVVGEYGTGKTALTQVLQYRWAQECLLDPSKPVPFRIELRDFTRQFDARGLLHHFLDHNRLGHLSVDFVLSLIRLRRVVLLLDGYDEMAQYLHARERRVCLEALAELSSSGARGILTSRPNYFSEAEEFQVFEILYSAVTQQREIHLMGSDLALIERERAVDQLLESHFLYRYERALKDLSPAQTEALVCRRLKDDPEGRNVVLGILRRVFRGADDTASVSLSGKPVIIAYLLQVVDELKKAKVESTLESRLTEWQLYKVIVDHLMLRDFRRTSYNIMPDQRRQFLHILSHWLSKQEHAYITENGFRDLIRKHFSKELRRVLPEEREHAVESYFADLRGSATLTRASVESRACGWRFSHNSLREFLLTEYLLESLQSGSEVDLQVPISDPMRTFVASKPVEELGQLLVVLAQRWPQRYAEYGLGEFLGLLWDAVVPIFSSNRDPVRAALIAITGEKVALDSVKLRRLVLSSEEHPTQLQGSTFQNSELVEVALVGANCEGADFSHAILENVNFRSAKLAHACFAGSALIDVNISGADVHNSDFRGIDLESSILTESTTAPEGMFRLVGQLALGYLQYRGAYTDVVPTRFFYMHFPKFAIVEKICAVLASQTAHQRLGLENRGTSQMDPPLARKFVDYLVRQGLAEVRRNRPGLVYTTPEGRNVFGLLSSTNELPKVIEDFVRSTMVSE